MPGLGRAVADRVEAETRHRPHFLVQRQDLAQQGVVRVAVAHAGDEAARHPQRELRGGLVRQRQGRIGQAEQGQQLARVAHSVAPQRLPARAGGRRRRADGCGRERGGLL